MLSTTDSGEESSQILFTKSAYGAMAAFVSDFFRRCLHISTFDMFSKPLTKVHVARMDSNEGIALAEIIHACSRLRMASLTYMSQSSWVTLFSVLRSSAGRLLLQSM